MTGVAITTSQLPFEIERRREPSTGLETRYDHGRSASTSLRDTLRIDTEDRVSGSARPLLRLEPADVAAGV